MQQRQVDPFETLDYAWVRENCVQIVYRRDLAD